MLNDWLRLVFRRFTVLRSFLLVRFSNQTIAKTITIISNAASDEISVAFGGKLKTMGNCEL